MNPHHHHHHHLPGEHLSTTTTSGPGYASQQQGYVAPGGYQQQPASGHQLHTGGYQQVPISGHQLQTGGYQQQPIGAHHQQPLSGHLQHPIGAHQQQPLSGHLQQPGGLATGAGAHTGAHAARTVMVDILEGRNLANVELIGKVDPYCLLLAGSDQVKTPVHKGGGTNLVFNDTAELALAQGVDEVLLEVHDHNQLRGDKLIGRGRVSVADVKFSGQVDDSWVELHDDRGRSTGQLHVKVVPRYSVLQGLINNSRDRGTMSALASVLVFF